MRERTRHYRANDRSLRGQHAEVTVRFDDELCTSVDEILTTQMHLERLDWNHVWMRVNGLTVNVLADKHGKISVSCKPDECEPSR